MPEQYTDIKQSYLDRGVDEKTAKKRAAMTFIAKGKGGTRHSRAVALQADRPKRARMGQAKMNRQDEVE
jgi:hypothetical protein